MNATMDVTETVLHQELDPFGFQLNQASALKPLGGTEASPDPCYAFHTPYADFGAGRIRFTIAVTGLQAAGGELHVRINGFVPQSGRDAVLVTATRISLTDVENGAFERILSIRGVAGVQYAVYGFIPDAVNISASAVSISVERDVQTDDADIAALDHPTGFGTDRLLSPPALVGEDRPSFRDPVSQCLTAGQLDDKRMGEWSKLLPAGLALQDRWSAALTLQALESYGMLHPGARGLGLCDGGDRLGTILGGHQCEILRCTHADGAIHWPAESRKDQSWRPSSDDLPLGLRGFDFLWSIGTLAALERPADIMHFVEHGLFALRKGGFAFFEIAMNHHKHGGSSIPGTLSRREIERLALNLMSRSHDVAQLNFGADDEAPPALDGPTPFILIVRRARAG